MKKLKLRALNLGAREILTREQLKSINGGCVQDSDCGTGSNVVCNSFKTCVGGSNWGGSGNQPDPSSPSYFGDFPAQGTANVVEHYHYGAKLAAIA
jgi:hypothetical protein